MQLTAFLFGISVLGAQIPLSTFARTDPDTAGYGLGADASFVSTLIGVYVVFLAVGAFTLPLTSRLLGPRGALVLGALLVAAGYALWLPLHDSTGQALVNMAVAGVGSGALVAALPATAAAAAPPDRTGFATGMINATKTMGGAIASSMLAMCLASAGSIKNPVTGHAPLSGYLAVWAICAVAALLAAAALLVMPARRPRTRSVSMRIGSPWDDEPVGDFDEGRGIRRRWRRWWNNYLAILLGAVGGVMVIGALPQGDVERDPRWPVRARRLGPPSSQPTAPRPQRSRRPAPVVPSHAHGAGLVRRRPGARRLRSCADRGSRARPG